MRPSTIRDEDVWPGAVRMVIAGPDGDLTGGIRPVEALVDKVDGATRFCMRIVLDKGDLEQLAKHGHFWLTMLGAQLQPFSLVMPDEREDDDA